MGRSVVLYELYDLCLVLITIRNTQIWVNMLYTRPFNEWHCPLFLNKFVFLFQYVFKRIKNIPFKSKRKNNENHQWTLSESGFPFPLSPPPVSSVLSAFCFGSDTAWGSNPSSGFMSTPVWVMHCSSQASGLGAALEPLDGGMAATGPWSVFWVFVTTSVSPAGSGWVLGSVRKDFPSSTSATVGKGNLSLRGAHSWDPTGLWLWLLLMLVLSLLFLLPLGPPTKRREHQK